MSAMSVPIMETTNREAVREGTLMAELEGKGPIADTPTDAKTNGDFGPRTVSPSHPERATERASTVAPAQPIGGRLRAFPAARRVAAERGIALQDLKGSGPADAIVMADLVASATAKILTPNRIAPTGAKHDLDHAAMRRAIAAAMSRTKRDIPHYLVTT